MKAICQREGLLAASQLASAAIPAKDLKPILKNLKAVAGDGRCTLIATDMEVGIRLDVRSATGGFGKVRRELGHFIRDLKRSRQTLPDLLVIGRDANCQGGYL